MKLPDFELPNLSSIFTPPQFTLPSYLKTTRIVNTIDNIQNINRLRDMDNLTYQIRLKEQQKSIYEKRLKSINSTIDVKIGRVLSIIIVLFSVIVPFIIVAFQELLKCFQLYIYLYLIISFVVSMISMCIYLFWFWKNNK